VTTLPILLYPSPAIRRKSVSVASIDGKLQRLIDNMIDTMYKAPGVGLAAPQVGELKRVIVLDPRDQGRPGKPLALINPEIVVAEGTVVEEEGCLCIPELRGGVPRFTGVVVKGYDRSEKEIVIEGSGLLARILQHEIDHLDGVLFIDRLSPARRTLLLNRLKKAAGACDRLKINRRPRVITSSSPRSLSP